MRIPLSLVPACLFAVLVTALIASWLRLNAVSDLWTTSYGQILLFKIGLVLVALAWGGIHHTFVRPRLERGETPPGVGRSLLGESVVALAVLFAAAVLVNGAPPPVDTGSTSAASTPGR